jgi:GDP-mannose transporter
MIIKSWFLLVGGCSKLEHGLHSVDWSTPAVSMLVISSVIGTLIGYTGWSCRSLVSATSFTLVGVLNKFLTILLNVLIWDKHATPFGIFALVICLGGGAFYQQSPLRSGQTAEKVAGKSVKDSEDEMQDDSGIEALPLVAGKPVIEAV